MNDSAVVDQDAPRADPSPWELPVVALAIGALIVLTLIGRSLSSGASVLYPWTRPFWLDEMHTLMLASESSPAEQLRLLGLGGDYNPPGLYVLLRGWSLVTGPPSEVALRLFAFLSMLVALTGVYWMLRQAAFRRAVAFAAAWSVWFISPLMNEQAFEARYYGPWLAACAWLCNGLIALERRPSVAVGTMTVICSVLVCTIHYFGAFAIALIGLSHLVFHRRNWLRTCLLLAPGPLVLFACVPLYLGQKAVLQGETWITAPTRATVLQFGKALCSPKPMAILAAFFVLGLILALARRRQLLPKRLSLLAGSFGLLALPICLVGFSFAVQPVIFPRYGIPFMVGLAPVIAILMAPLRGWLLALALVPVTFVGSNASRAVFEVKDEMAILPLLDQTDLPANALLVFPSRHTAYVAWRYRPDAGRCAILFEGSTKRGEFVRTESRVAERMSQLYPELPGVIARKELVGVETVYLIENRPAEQVAAILPTVTLKTVTQKGKFTLYQLLTSG